MRRIGKHFDYQVSALTPAQLADYFTQIKAQHSWSGVKLDLYGLKFFTEHVLGQPWQMPGFIRPPKVSRLPDIVSVEQARAIFEHTRVLSYRVLFFVLYSLGLRLGEGLALTVADIDAQRMRVHVRNAKGNRDRLVPLPEATLAVLRAFWGEHRHPRLLFPNRAAGREGARRANSPLDRGGVQRSLARVVHELGLKERVFRTIGGRFSASRCLAPGRIDSMPPLKVDAGSGFVDNVLPPRKLPLNRDVRARCS